MILHRRKFCECGKCGRRVKPGNRFISGHNLLLPEVQEKSKRRIREMIDNGEIQVWNKGLTASEDERVADNAYKVHATTRKRYAEGEIVIWNKDLSTGPQSLEHVMSRVVGRGEYRHTKRVKRKIRKTNLKTWSNPEVIAKVSGENSVSWLGGISKLPYSQNWTEALKETIRVRDGRVCQVCDRTEEENGVRLCVHHIDYDKENQDPKNLISLCVPCHVRTNMNRSRWKHFFLKNTSLRLVRRAA